MIPALVDTIDFEGAVSLYRASHVRLRMTPDTTCVVQVVMNDEEAFTVFRGDKSEALVYLQKLKQRMYCLSIEELLRIPANPWELSRKVSKTLPVLKSILDELTKIVKASRGKKFYDELLDITSSLSLVATDYEQALK